MSLAKTGATHIYAQLKLLDKGHTIKELGFLWVLSNRIPLVFGQNRRHLASLSYLVVGPGVKVTAASLV